MDGLLIGEVARRAGLRPSALRYYESAGLLPAPRRVNGRRRYSEDVMERLAIIRLARRAGFRITEIRALFEGPGTPPMARWRALARSKVAELDAFIQRAEQMKRLLEPRLDCSCVRLEDCAVATGESCPATR